MGDLVPYLQYEKIPEEKTEEKITKKKKKTKKLKADVNELLKNVSIPKGLELESIDLEKAQFLCSLPKVFRVKPRKSKRNYSKYWKIWSISKM
jgi:DNA topoisomerase-1